MGDRTQVNLRVDPERKEEWVNYVEESPEVENLTQLIRFAVTRHINDDVQGNSPEVSVDTSGIEQSLTRLENKMDALSDDVGVVKREVSGPRTPVPDLYADPEDVFDEIPSGEGPEDGINVFDLKEKFPDVEGVPSIAERLEREMSAVKKSRNQPTRYWKEDD